MQRINASLTFQKVIKMEDQKVGVEVALKAHELGFDEPNVVSRTSQAHLQKWLRDTHKIHVRVDNVNRPVVGKWYYEIQRLNTGIIYLWNPSNPVYDSYEQALEEGLFNALIYLKGK